MKDRNSLLLKLALIVSLGLNVYIFNEVKNSPYNGSNPSQTGTTPTQTVTSLSLPTNVTELVDTVINKVVSIVNIQAGKQVGSGSGVVYKNENGKILIVTNHHVIEGSQSLTVQFSDGETADGKLIGSDQYTDLALISVDIKKDIKPFEIGDSNASKVGEYVIAVGSPIGLEYANSVTFGIISGKDRVVPVDLNNDGRADWDMIVTQTDAAINPGNSGGALVNMAGQLIGINSMKLSNTTIEGMGFSIPSTEVLTVVQQLETTGKVEYPMIGISAVSLEDLNSYYYRIYEIDSKLDGGVLIADIVSGGAAEKSGLKKGDVITQVDGKNVATFKEFRKVLFSHKVGDTIKIRINRSGQETDISVTLK